MILKSKRLPLIICSLVFPLISLTQSALAQEFSALNGLWQINEELSDDTDIQVEKAIKAAGGKVKRSMRKKGKGRYKGGPPEQALYDHISYDETLEFNYQEPEFRLVYENFERVFHSDGRGRSASARGGSRAERKDYAFASWSGPHKLFVESRPRDGGRTREVYSLTRSESGEELLKVELNLDPLLFSGPIHIVRIYQRATTAPAWVNPD